MEQRFLIDTNILIYFADGKIPTDQAEKITQILQSSFLISTISRIEFLGWNKLSGDNLAKAEAFLASAQVFYVDSTIEAKATELKRLYKMATPDAIVAATALANQLTLVTRNTKDFERITTLALYNPFEV
jgi:toxin FitB